MQSITTNINLSKITGILFGLVFVFLTAKSGQSYEHSDLKKIMAKNTSHQSSKSKKNAQVAPNNVDLQVKAVIEQEKLSYKANQLVRKLPTKEQAAAVESLPPDVFVNVPAFWQHIHKPKVLFDALHTFGEPLNSDALDAIQRLVPSTTDSEERLQAVALLYRYSRPYGRSELIRLMENHMDIRATSILAINHEDSLLDPILLNFSRQDAPDYVLTKALGQWQRQEIEKALFKRFQNAPTDPYLALALANQNSVEALPLLRQAYFTMTPDQPSKYYMGAAIVKLDNEKAFQIRAFLMESLLHPAAGNDMRFYIIDAFSQLEQRSSSPELTLLVENYVKRSHGNSAYSSQSETQIALLAGVSLAKFNPKGSRPLLTQLLVIVKDDESAILQCDDLARAMLKFEGTRTEIQKIYGKDWLNSELLKQSLRPLTADMLLDTTVIITPG